MPPLPGSLASTLQKRIATSTVLVFSKTTCPYCEKVKKLFNELKVPHAVYEIDKKSNGSQIQCALAELTGSKTVPQVFIRGKFIGGWTDTNSLHEQGKLQDAVKNNKYDYDLVVIGGGSGGLAMSKEAAVLGAKVALLDFVVPTPKGAVWGIGGTCVNVGCIPKKLMHQAALIKHTMEDAKSFGWNVPEKIEHSWSDMVTGIQDHIGSLNWGYRVALREKGVTYLNAFGELKDAHTIMAKNKAGEVKEVTAQTIVLATGERPRYPDIVGAKEYAITSDDLFSLDYCPGKTLVIGASYVALECAGFLNTLGLNVTVMVRSIFLRGFDQQMADMVGNYMETEGVNFIRPCVPISIKEKKPHNADANQPGLYEVTGVYTDGTPFKDLFNTVIFAVGRDPMTDKLNLKGVGVAVDKAGRVICDEEETTSVPNIYAIGDIVSGKLQLTPVAIHAGKNLARRLYKAESTLTEYTNVPTTVFTPLEYGAIGLAEEDAKKKFGADNIEVYHSHFKPLEWTVAHRGDNVCYAKLLVNMADDDRVVGLHVLGPNAGEITQGFAIGIKLGATKEDFDRTIGIHPTSAEVFTSLWVSKSSGGTAKVTGC